MLVPDPGRPAGVLARDPWATSAPFRVLGLMTLQERETESPPLASLYPRDFISASRGWLKSVILNLVRAASTRPHVAEHQLYPLARQYPIAVVMAGSTALTELAEIRPGPADDVRRALEQAANECDPEDLEDW